MQVDRIHYAGKPVILGPRRYDAQELGTYSKPGGLWYSVEGDGSRGWYEYCRAEDFRQSSLVCAHRLEIDLPRVLRIADAPALRRFEAAYAADPDPVEVFAAHALRVPVRATIDWSRVRAEWAGIEIAPYQYECRLDVAWYYPWDCASGCIWDLSVITQFEYMPAWQPVTGDARV